MIILGISPKIMIVVERKLNIENKKEDAKVAKVAKVAKLTINSAKKKYINMNHQRREKSIE